MNVLDERIIVELLSTILELFARFLVFSKYVSKWVSDVASVGTGEM